VINNATIYIYRVMDQGDFGQQFQIVNLFCSRMVDKYHEMIDIYIYIMDQGSIT
jgi:hypothetical protein